MTQKTAAAAKKSGASAGRKVEGRGAAKTGARSAASKRERWNGVADLKDHRREAILRSVANVLRNSRLSSLTIKDVADELGMTKGNLYYYFKDKQDILYHCHMRSMEISLRALAEGIAQGRTPAEKLRIALIGHIRGIVADGFGGILQTDLEKIRPAQRRQYIGKRDQFEHGVRDLIEAGVRAGELACDNIKLAGFAILGGINWIPKWYRPDGPLSPEQIAEQMADFYLRALCRGAAREDRTQPGPEGTVVSGRQQQPAGTETWR